MYKSLQVLNIQFLWPLASFVCSDDHIFLAVSRIKKKNREAAEYFSTKFNDFGAHFR